MLRWCGIATTILFLVCFTTVRADHLAFQLKVKAGDKSQEAETEKQDVGVKAKERKVLHAKAKEKLRIDWILTNVSDKESAKNVLVHLIVVKEEKVGQQKISKANKDIAAESAVIVDFAPKEKTKGDLKFVINEPGAYLVRIETIGAAAGAEGHEHFAALDLIIE